MTAGRHEAALEQGRSGNAATAAPLATLSPAARATLARLSAHVEAAVLRIMEYEAEQAAHAEEAEARGANVGPTRREQGTQTKAPTI